MYRGEVLKLYRKLHVQLRYEYAIRRIRSLHRSTSSKELVVKFVAVNLKLCQNCGEARSPGVLFKYFNNIYSQTGQTYPLTDTPLETVPKKASMSPTCLQFAHSNWGKGFRQFGPRKGSKLRRSKKVLSQLLLGYPLVLNHVY